MKRGWLHIWRISAVVLSCGLLLRAADRDKAGKYEPAWESLDSRPIPQWYPEAKFGIFIHWGVYSVPAWADKEGACLYVGQKDTKVAYNQRMRTPGSATWRFHRRVYGENFEYKDFAPMFKAELFDPNEWAALFRRSGARYVVLTARHNTESFCLWPAPDSKNWNSVEVGPKRDLVGDLTRAVRAEGLRMGLYYGLIEWYNPYSSLYEDDFDRYIDTRVFPQLKDLVTRYRPSLLFFDGDWAHPAEAFRTREFLAWLYNEAPCRREVVVNDRLGKGCRHKHGDYYTTEYGAGLKDASHPWEENRGMGRSFSYNRAEGVSAYLSAGNLVLMLADIVSRGGNLLLGIGPRADGRIPVIMEERLSQMGRWLAVNGEAIYASHCWRTPAQWSEGKRPQVEYGKMWMAKYDVGALTTPRHDGTAFIEAFFTRKDDALYAITPHWPKRELVLKDIPVTEKTTVTLLGFAKPLAWRRDGKDVVIQVPALSVEEMPCRHAYVFKLTNLGQ